MTSRSHRRPSRPATTITAAAGLLALAALLAACGGSVADGSPGAQDPSGSPAGSVEPGPAIDTDALLADPSLDGQAVRVNGFFLATGDQAQLCSIVLESYPPQCGGGTVRITGEVPADVLAALDSTNDPALAQATWGQVEVTGTFRATGADGGPTIELGTIAPAPPLGG
jgi:hypothetical protein